MKYVECVPNFSEGRRPEVVRRISAAIAAVPGAVILDSSSDASHNRTVITFVAPLEAAVEAAFAGIRQAFELIDLTVHAGEHPRIGAADVVPFIPLGETTMDECVALARALGARVGAELAVPVYLYERAATSSGRVNLAHVRKGNFEGLRDLIGREEARAPDFGPNRIHPTFGAIAIGARPVLVAYNIYLGNESALPVARRIASGVRETGGGLPAVKAMGLLVDGQAQVSMNLVDIDRTPVHVAFDAVRRAAEGEGLSVTWSEIVGLVPERALVSAGIANLRLDRFNTSQILEKRVHEALHDEPTVSDFLGQVASASPVPGGGTAAAHSASLAAALVEMVAAVTQGRKKFAPVESEMRTIVASATELRATLSALARADSDAYSAVAAAYKLPRNTDKEFRSRGAAIDAALLQAARVPLDTARQAVHVARLALKVTERGNPNALSDGGVAALLAQAAVRGASYNVRVNVASLSDPREGLSLAAESVELTREVEQLAERVREVVERAIALG